ncbi:MAG TPA: hypothetical protein VKZ44_09965 [Taishania sp.]|nr:hypothetical protein [Taishania sp.]
MKWIGNRISFVDQKDKTTIVIYPEKKAWMTTLMGAWIFMWYGIGFTVIWSYFALNLNQQEKLILVIFMSFWLYYAVRVTRTFLWILKGTENIKIDSIGLSYKLATGKMGKAHMYYLENIKKFRLEVPKDKSFQNAFESTPWIRGGERLEFDYMGKVVRFGRKLEEKDAKLLFSLITKRIEEQLKQRSKKSKEY